MEAGSGPQLFERSEFCGPPPESSTAGCPQRSEGTQTVGSPFLCLLSFGEAKESESAAGRISRPRERKEPPKDRYPRNLFRVRASAIQNDTIA